MKKYLSIIEKSSIFRGIEGQEIEPMLKCLSATTSTYKKQEFILRNGDYATNVGMILAGSATIIQEDFWGNRNIITKICPSQLFAETYACNQGIPLHISVIASEPATVLYLDVNRVLTTCSSSCQFHNRLIRNLVSSLAQKNLLMNEKMLHMAQRTTREKLLSYLSAEAIEQGSSSFEIPYNRQQLADYLSVDRSAMSNELSKLQKEGTLTYTRNHFTLTL